jgi:AcrR family transcriptional regulator
LIRCAVRVRAGDESEEAKQGKTKATPIDFSFECQPPCYYGAVITDVVEGKADSRFCTYMKQARNRIKTGNGKMGRPIKFDKDAALEAAMLLFWERGYEGTSMADLTEAMGLNPSSIYAAFGDKHALFSLAVKRYMDSRAQYAAKALKEPTLKKAVRALFESTVAFLTTPNHPPTCTTLAGAVGCSVDASPARDIMTEIRKQNESAMRERFLQARKNGELPKDINVDDYTRYLSSILAGLSIQAANGSTKAELKRTAQMALRHLGY